MYKVLITTSSNDNGMLRQTKQSKGVSLSGEYQFYVNADIKDPDFWVVRNKFVKSKMTKLVSPKNTILLLSEPYSVTAFPVSYRKQFGTIVSCQTQVKGENVIYSHAQLPWFIGRSDRHGIRNDMNITYDMLRDNPFPDKTKLLSVITSAKAFTAGHQQRLKFVEQLKKHFGDKVDVYGRGIRDFDDKWNVLAPYKYHIAIENSSSKHYWTEKLSDCYLTGTFPVYYGCKNIDEYFPDGAYARIDINNPHEAIKIIESVIEDGMWDKRQDELKEAKKLTLDKYNIIEEITSVCDRLDATATKEEVTLRPACNMLNLHNMYLSLFQRSYYKIRQSLGRF